MIKYLYRVEDSLLIFLSISLRLGRFCLYCLKIRLRIINLICASQCLLHDISININFLSWVWVFREKLLQNFDNLRIKIVKNHEVQCTQLAYSFLFFCLVYLELKKYVIPLCLYFFEQGFWAQFSSVIETHFCKTQISISCNRITTKEVCELFMLSHCKNFIDLVLHLVL